MDYPIIYDKLTVNPDGFLGYGLAIVENAKDICIHEVLNGEYTLSFALPINDPKWQYIVEENFVKMEGQIFVIRNISDVHGTDFVCTVTCEHIFFLLLDEYIEYLEIEDGTSAVNALTSVLDGTEFTVGTVDVSKTNDDITIIENQNPIAAINNVINIWGGEIKVDNWSVGLLTHRGSTAPNIQFRYRKNMKSIKRTVDSSSLVTRLYVYGNDGLTIEDAVENTSGLKYIDSQYINSYRRPKKGTVNFDIDDPDELYTKALEYLTKAEIPAVSYEVDVIELKKLAEYGELEEFTLGDEAMVVDEVLGINVQARILDYTYYPKEDDKSKVVLANFRPGIENTLSELRSLKNQITTGDGSIKVSTSWFEGTINALQNQLKASGSYATKEAVMAEGKGIIFENTAIGTNDYGALFIGPGVLAISNEKIGSEWNWRAFGTGDGFTGDEIVSGTVKSQFVQIGQNTTFETGYNPATKNTTYVQDTDPSLLWEDFVQHLKDTWYSPTAQVGKMLTEKNDCLFAKGEGLGASVVGNGYAGSSFTVGDRPIRLTDFGIKMVSSGVITLYLWKVDADFKLVELLASGVATRDIEAGTAKRACDITLDANTNYAVIFEVMGGQVNTVWNTLVVEGLPFTGVLNRGWPLSGVPTVGTELTNTTEIYLCLGYYDWIEVENALVENWRTAGTTTIDGGKITTTSITADKLVVDQATIDWLNAREIVAGSVKAENIDTTTAKISTAKIEDLFIGTGGNVTMGAGAVIAWENLDATCQTNLKGEQGIQGPEGPQGPAGADGSDANVPSWVTAWNGGATLITSGYICSPKIFIGAGGQLATGMKIDEDGINSYSNNKLHGWVLDNDNLSDFLVYYQGELRGTIQQSAGVFAIYPGANSTMQLGIAGKTVNAKGDWDFSGCSSVTGLRAQWG